MKKPTVFVVDDEIQICVLLTRILQREGYTVRSFVSGQEAVDALATDRPDLLVTDLMMPGMSGLELVRRARAQVPEMGAVLTTGYASIENVVDALRSGVNDFVTKPFSVAEIRGVVSRVLQGGRAETPAPHPEPVVADVHAADATLARRFRDMSLIESIHGLLAEEPTSGDLLPRCESSIVSAFGHGRAALLAPGHRGGTFRVRSATQKHGPWASRIDAEIGVLSLVVVSGVPALVHLPELAPVNDLLDDGFAAAAPLCPRDPLGEDSGVLVVSRPDGASPFDAEDLRLLGVVAGALGDVFRAVRTAERTEDAYVESLCDVVEATEARSHFFAHHSERVRELSLALARRLGLPSTDVEVLDMASRLLDLGRVETPDGLLANPGRLNADEWTTLRHHSVAGDRLVRPLGRLRHVRPIIRHHHENWDGSGYPDGLRGEEIPFLAALVRITDAFAALTSERAWRPAMDESAAVRQIVDLSGRHFHPQLVAAFTEMQYGSVPRNAVHAHETAEGVTQA